MTNSTPVRCGRVWTPRFSPTVGRSVAGGGRLPIATLLLVLSAGACAPTAGSSAGGSVAPAGEEYLIHEFRKLVLSDRFYAEGANFGDLNGNGIMDIVAGPYWYEGPDFRVRHEYYPAREFDPEVYSDNFFAHVYDFDGDGWNDILIIGFPGREASWYQNPREGGGHWRRHLVFEGVGGESPAWTDLTGDGRPELVCVHDGHVGYVRVDWSDPSRPWRFHPISPKGNRGQFTHGTGVGDINGNGRLDIVMADGWWEHPPSLEGDPVWAHHPVNFGDGGAQMYVHDLNGSGKNDVVTSLRAHGWGLAWFEQVERDGRREFVKHVIMNETPEENRYGVRFSQVHALDFVDIDGDGIPDIVTGKRYWAHGSGGDPEPNAPPVLYWFRTVPRGDGSVDFVPYLIDDDSGVGVQVVAGDVSGNGLPDVVISNKKGTFVFLHETVRVDRATWEAAQPKPYPTEEEIR
jgi:hypothetical protein